MPAPARIILSRKGMDAAWGGCPSPILPDGRLAPLPIPEPGAANGVPYRSLRTPDGRSASALLRALGRDALVHPAAAYRGEGGGVVRVPLGRARAHLDPDLVPGAAMRASGWRPAFGQVGGAQSHLAAQGVGTGDLFLFFGWFRGTRRDGRRLRWTGPDLHVLWGWLQVAEVIDLTDHEALAGGGGDGGGDGDGDGGADGDGGGGGDDGGGDGGGGGGDGGGGGGGGGGWDRPRWSHPHLDGRALPRYARGNTLYLATEHLGLDPSRPGAGTFAALAPALRLTASGATRSVWDLPEALHPDETPAPLSWHSPGRWARGPAPGRATLRSVRGQEFVVGATPGVLDWVRQVLATA